MKITVKAEKKPEERAEENRPMGIDRIRKTAGQAVVGAGKAAFQAGRAVGGAGEAVRNAGKAVSDARENAGRAVQDARKSAGKAARNARKSAGKAVDHVRTAAGRTVSDFRRDADYAYKARKLDRLEKRERNLRTVRAKERAKARNRERAIRELLGDDRKRSRERDRARLRALREERAYRMPSASFIPAMLYTVTALCSLTLGSRKKSWIYHITGMLNLFIAGLFFFLDFSVRKTDDV